MTDIAVVPCYSSGVKLLPQSSNRGLVELIEDSQFEQLSFFNTVRLDCVQLVT